MLKEKIVLHRHAREADNLGEEPVEKNQLSRDQGFSNIIEPGAPEIVLTVLILAALGILAFAFSSCF